VATRSPWPGQVVDGEIASDDDFNSIPGGWLGYAVVTADQGSITTAVDLTGMSLSVTVPANRLLRISSFLRMESTVANDVGQLVIAEGATTLNSALATFAAANGPHSMYVEVLVVAPSAGSHSYKLTAQRTSGTGTLTMKAAATNPASFVVEDLGPSS
jgi:hypothetical protein